MAVKRVAKSILDFVDDKLDMSSAAKNARAAQMNMEPGYFHGTSSEIKQFSPLSRGSATGARSAQKAYWVVDDPVTAGSYAEHSATNARVQKLIKEAGDAEKKGNFDLYEQKIIEAEDLDAALTRDNLAVGGQNILPLRVNANLKEVNMKGRSFNDEGVSDEINRYLDSAKDEGFAGVKFLNLDDAAGLTNRPATHVAMFDAKDIRSEFAKFDPAKASSPDLLASATPVAVGAGILGSLGLPQDATAADIAFAERQDLSPEGKKELQQLILDSLMGFFAPTPTAGREAQMMPMSQQMRGQ
jgi:hypothetical protein